MTQPGNLTSEERARAVGKQILEQSDSCKGVLDCLDLMEALIASALADERRRGKREGMEEAKLIADTVAAKHPAPEDWMARLAALSISNLIGAKAQEAG